MKLTSLLACTLLLGLSNSSYAQEYSYTHYDITDGLAGSVVYCITQDPEGFMWVGTETGVSRFDGTHFRTFDVADGLPDVEILQLFADSRGRVWMAPFKRSLCYYYRGVIHNQENDPALRSIQLKGNILNFAEDASGNILMQERTALHLLGADGSVKQIDSIGDRPIRNCGSISASKSGHFFVKEGRQVYTFSGKAFEPFCSVFETAWTGDLVAMNSGGLVSRETRYGAVISSFIDGRKMYLPFKQRHFTHISFSIVGDSLYYFNEITGASEHNLYTGATRYYLPGKEVSRTYRDQMGNIWFTTLGQGIFRLNSDEFRTIRLRLPGMEESAVFGIRRWGNQLLVADNHNYLYRFSLPDMILRQEFSTYGSARNRTLFMGSTPDGGLYLASDNGLETITPGFHRTSYLGLTVKSVFEYGPGRLLLATNWGAGIFDLRNFRITDTIWHERTTVVFARRDTLYLGTLNGLYIIRPDGSVFFPGNEIPFLRKRISAIAASPDGVLWIGSYSSGVMAYRNGRELTTINRQRGLTSDICRTLLVHDGILWVGTDKGLNRVRLQYPGLPIDQYTSNDGLGSNMVNSIFADSLFVYVGTQSGISFFDEKKINTTEGCRLYLLSVLNSGRERIADTSSLLLPYADRHLRLEFAGISYRSVGGVVYRYRLLGLDSNWRETKETTLEYQMLPSGQYDLQLQAVNKFGAKSANLHLPFEVITPFWQRTWFYVLIIGGFLFLTWLIATIRIKNIRRRQQEEKQLARKMNEMEHMALQAQMNPHFIFNCLNSIQQYIFDQDILAANKYITGFSRLIRATMQHSSKPFIPLADEISYLSTYLSLEKLRFKEKMTYTIECGEGLDTEDILIPPMLIQPYVENSIRHGLRHKTDGKGQLLVRIALEASDLVVNIEDNGIGRKKASLYKTSEHIEYQSKGMSMTAERIGLINTIYGQRIEVEVIDLNDLSGRACGTRVVIKIPLFSTSVKSQPYDQDSIG